MTVVAAGNSGSSCSSVEVPPAIYDSVYTVGSTNSFNEISSFSSRGPVLVDGSGRLKPDLSAPGEDVRSSADGGGYANPANTLGITNWVLGGNVKISPWLHLQTDSQNYAPIPPGSELIAETSVADLFERKGHEFVDLDVAVFFEANREPAMSARLRAIYKMRGL